MDTKLHIKDEVKNSRGGSLKFYKIVSPKAPFLCFRTLTWEDLPDLKELQDILFPVKYSDKFYEGLLEPDVVTLMVIQCHCQPDVVGKNGCPHEDRVPGGKCITHQVVGVATGRAKELRSGCQKAKEGYITTLGVHPSLRHMGIGALLVNEVNNLLWKIGCTSVGLHVKEDNDIAIRMYLNAGFSKAEHLLNHYHIEGVYHNAFRLVIYAPLVSMGSTWTCTIM